MIVFCLFQQYSSRHRKVIRQLRAPSLLDSSGLVPQLLLPAPRQAGKACSASCVLFSCSCKNSFDLTAESFACTFFYKMQFLVTIPDAIRHLTRETREDCVTNTLFAAAPSAYGCSCRMCDFLGRMVLLKKTAPIKFLCWCLLWFTKRRDLVAFLRCKHTHRNGGVRDVHVLICTPVVQIGVAVQGAII